MNFFTTYYYVCCFWCEVVVLGLNRHRPKCLETFTLFNMLPCHHQHPSIEFWTFETGCCTFIKFNVLNRLASYIIELSMSTRIKFDEFNFRQKLLPNIHVSAFSTKKKYAFLSYLLEGESISFWHKAIHNNSEKKNDERVKRIESFEGQDHIRIDQNKCVICFYW